MTNKITPTEHPTQDHSPLDRIDVVIHRVRTLSICVAVLVLSYLAITDPNTLTVLAKALLSLASIAD